MLNLENYVEGTYLFDIILMFYFMSGSISTYDSDASEYISEIVSLINDYVNNYNNSVIYVDSSKKINDQDILIRYNNFTNDIQVPIDFTLIRGKYIDLYDILYNMGKYAYDHNILLYN